MLSIIICDDEPLVCEKLEKMVADIFSELSVKVRTFPSREALENLLQSGPEPDIALLDIKLSGDDGIQL